MLLDYTSLNLTNCTALTSTPQGSCVAGLGSRYAPNRGVEVWRCTEDHRNKQGGNCNFDLCDKCRAAIEAECDSVETLYDNFFDNTFFFNF